MFSVSANELWKGVTGVSNAGRKRGRGRGAGVKRKRDLNRGQMIGVGESEGWWRPAARLTGGLCISLYLADSFRCLPVVVLI